MRPYGQYCIQHQYTLLSPFGQASVIRDRTSKIIMEFFINIHKRRWNIYPLLYRKAKTMRLSYIMIRILSQNNRFYIM